MTLSHSFYPIQQNYHLHQPFLLSLIIKDCQKAHWNYAFHKRECGPHGKKQQDFANRAITEDGTPNPATFPWEEYNICRQLYFKCCDVRDGDGDKKGKKFKGTFRGVPPVSPSLAAFNGGRGDRSRICSEGNTARMIAESIIYYGDPNYVEGVRHPEDEKLCYFFLEVLLKVKNNYFLIYDEMRQPLGYGIYDQVSVVNHSCRPNAMVVNTDCRPSQQLRR